MSYQFGRETGIASQIYAATPVWARAALGLATIIAVARLVSAWSTPLTFDDAYMFYRYARFIGQGLGVAWNPDGVPVYGLTGQLWVYFVLPLTLLPFSAGAVLQFGSWLVGMAAIVMLAMAMRNSARSELLRNPVVILAVVALPLLINPLFARHLTTGMDTMLSLLTNAALVIAAVRYSEKPSGRRAVGLGCLGFVAILARPDNVLCALGIPLLTWLFASKSRDWRDLFGLALLPALLLTAEALTCKWYFGVPLPLSFYMKWLNSYAGFQNQTSAVRNAYQAALCALPFVVVLAATVRRDRLPLLLALLIPVAATLCSLLTVRQVMGMWGRYYIPFLPILVFPALLCLDDALVRGLPSRRKTAWAVAATVLVYAALVPVERIAEKTYDQRVVRAAIAVPDLPAAARTALPKLDWFTGIELAGRLVANLPPGTVIATSEVGYLGYVAPQATIIDLVGLNDMHIATHGFDMEYLLDRSPDLIWFPHSDYTGLRALIFSDPRLFKRYVIVRDVLNYGVAIRRDSPLKDTLLRRLHAIWSQAYPAQELDDYVVLNR